MSFASFSTFRGKLLVCFPHRGPHPQRLGRLQVLAQPEVDQLELEGAADDHRVLGLDVSVAEAVLQVTCTPQG